MDDHISNTPDSQSKPCRRCNQTKPLTEFYARNDGTGARLSECKSCMKERSKTGLRLPPNEPRAKTEILAIDELKRNGIHALPGKAVKFSDVDVVAFGCVRIEVKYSKLDTAYNDERYIFSATPAQRRRGFLAEIVMLVCDNGAGHTFHLFPSDFPAFYMKGRMKIAFDFLPGRMAAGKHANNRVVMTQPMMDEAQNNWKLVWDTLIAKSLALRKEGA